MRSGTRSVASGSERASMTDTAEAEQSPAAKARPKMKKIPLGKLDFPELKPPKKQEESQPLRQRPARDPFGGKPNALKVLADAAYDGPGASSSPKRKHYA